MAKEKANAAGTAPVAEATGATPTAEVGKAPVAAIKVISENIEALIVSTSQNLKGELVGDSLSAAVEKLKNDTNRRSFFDPSLSQYKEQLVLYFEPSACKVREVPVGRGTNTAIVITCPAGMRQPDGTVNFDRVFNAYVSTFRKSIQVTDEVGDPVLDENRQPKVVDGYKNAVWARMHACHNEAEVISELLGKKMLCTKIMRDFGPAVFVEQADGSRKATSHRMTALPLFEEIV